MKYRIIHAFENLVITMNLSLDFGPANTPVPRPRSQSYRPRKQQQGTSAARGDMFNQKSEDSIVVVRFETSPEMKKN